jgi:hypothetical protein
MKIPIAKLKTKSVKTRAEQGAVESEDEINETVLKRLKKLANI